MFKDIFMKLHTNINKNENGGNARTVILVCLFLELACADPGIFVGGGGGGVQVRLTKKSSDNVLFFFIYFFFSPQLIL